MASRRSKKPLLTTSAVAVLGQVAVSGPLSAYELAQTMRRNVHFFWPRAASHVYAEAKILEKAGLLATHRTFVGRRPRTEYRITAPGRKALRAHLGTPLEREPALEFEGLLRVFLASESSPEDLARVLAQTVAQADALLTTLEAHGREYAEGTSAFQPQAHVRALVYDFFVPYIAHVRKWAARSQGEVAGWKDTKSEGKDARARKRFRELSALARRARS